MKMKNGVRQGEDALRLYDFEAVCGSAAEDEYPEEYETERRASVKNQGDIAACVACAVSEVGEYLFGKEMSEAWAYGALRADSDKGKGMYVSRALELWRSLGLVSLSEFGTLREMPEARELVKKFPELAETAKKYRIGSYAGLNYASAEKKDKAIKQALLRDGVGLLAVSPDYFGENHCVVICGWNDKNGTYKIQNSWGLDWGDGGFGEIPKDDIAAVYAVLADEVTLPFEDVETDRWSYGAIKNMYLSGLINGVSENAFKPERPITREEAAAIFDRLCGSIDEKIGRIYKQINETRE